MLLKKQVQKTWAEGRTVIVMIEKDFSWFRPPSFSLLSAWMGGCWYMAHRYIMAWLQGWRFSQHKKMIWLKRCLWMPVPMQRNNLAFLFNRLTEPTEVLCKYMQAFQGNCENATCLWRQSLYLYYTTEELCCGKRFCATTEVHSPRTNVQLSVEEKKLFWELFIMTIIVLLLV